MDGGSERDTVPGFELPGFIECEHCGCEAVVGDTPTGVELDCLTCGHPGKVEIDSTGQLAWSLRAGGCNDPKCGDCSQRRWNQVKLNTEEAKAHFHLIDESLWAVPDATKLVELARKLSEGTGVPSHAALQLIVSELRQDLSTALRTLDNVASLARRQLTAHVVTHEALQ